MGFTKLFLESSLFAIKSLATNKLRTTLSLLGVLIGIFVIILILAAVNSLKRELNERISSLGDNVVFVHKWPWEGGFDYPWWKYWQRPQPSLKEMEQLKNELYLSDAVSFRVVSNRTVHFRNNNVPSAEINGIWLDYNKVHAIEIGSGRYFTESEIRNGKPVAVLGYELAQGLFGPIPPLNQQVKIGGRRFTVIGVLAKEGESLFGTDSDTKVYISYTAIRGMVDMNNWRTHKEIVVKARDGVSNAELREELTGLMRSIRKLRPSEENDFSLNETSIIAKQTGGMFVVLDIIGVIIGMLAVLVGAFGISNIMFVSVKERTSIIGIQKALGAKKSFILLQFLAESLLLSVVGGLIGILLVSLAGYVVSTLTIFNLYLSTGNIVLALLISSVIGIASGMAPAYSAAKMDPVEAIRQ